MKGGFIMNLKQLKTSLAPLALAITIAAPTLAPTHVEAREGRGGGHMFKKMKSLNLTEDQKKKVKEIREKDHEQVASLRKELKSAMTELREAAKKNASKDDLTRLFNTVQEKKQALAKQRFNKALEIREILTPEQRKKAADMMDEFFKEHKGRFKKGHARDRNDDEGDEE